MFNEVNPSEKELCLVDICTTNSILTKMKYFQNFEEKRRKCFNHRWSRCFDSWFWSSHYHSPHGYTNSYRGCFVVS